MGEVCEGRNVCQNADAEGKIILKWDIELWVEYGWLISQSHAALVTNTSVKLRVL
jgi:hypothetical protein